jgi:hypothetical protein
VRPIAAETEASSSLRVRAVTVEDFPDAGVSVWTGWSRAGPIGSLLYRIDQCNSLLHFPDIGDSDFSAAERRAALDRQVVCHKPLTALALFLGVVALEDYLRDFGARLSVSADFLALAPTLKCLAQRRVSKPARRVFERLDRDAFNPVDPEAVNAAFEEAIGRSVISPNEYARLRDFALIRHTVAHHASIVRPIDVSRFQYYEMRPGASLNPPPEFVKDCTLYLWQVARSVEIRVRNRLLELLRPDLPENWRRSPPANVLRFIAFFEYFGHIETARRAVSRLPDDEPSRTLVLEERERIQSALVESSLQEIESPTAKSLPPI